MPSTVVTTSATTAAIPRGAVAAGNQGAEVVYELAKPSATSYTVEPHPPTPRTK